MCCRDLSPFSIINKPGFCALLQQYGIVRDPAEIPDRTSLARAGLDGVYESNLQAVKQLVVTSPLVVAMTTDMWTDNYRRRSYITFTLHFCNAEYELKSVVLKTVLFTGSHTGENIKKEMIDTTTEFGLESKKIIYVTDNGSNIVKACTLAGLERIGCIAHGVHNLITVDGMSKSSSLTRIVKEVKNIVHAFVYKTQLLEEEGRKMVQEQLIDQIAGEEVNIENIDYDHYDDDVVAGDDADKAAVSLAEDQPARSQYTTTLKKECPTRWNSLLTMLESLLKSRQLVERCLASLRLFDKIPSLDDWQIIQDLVNFLQVFKKATELLSGSQYPTCSMALLFRSELASALEAGTSDSSVIAELKRNMRARFDYRFPVSDLHVCAAMLDPSQRHLAIIQQYLAQREINGVEFLSNMISKYCSTSTGMAASPGPTSSANNDDEPAWKKAKQEMIAKHINVGSSTDRELQQYRCISIASDDLLQWWKRQADTFPKLSLLAQGILAIPATSAPSERVFSTAGLVLQAKRSSLAPENVNKIIFVHDNGHLLQ